MSLSTVFSHTFSMLLTDALLHSSILPFAVHTFVLPYLFPSYPFRPLQCHCVGVPVNSRVSSKIQQLLNTLKRPKRPPLREFFVDDFEELLDGKLVWMLLITNTHHMIKKTKFCGLIISETDMTPLIVSVSQELQFLSNLSIVGILKGLYWLCIKFLWQCLNLTASQIDSPGTLLDQWLFFDLFVEQRPPGVLREWLGKTGLQKHRHTVDRTSLTISSIPPSP